MAFLRWMFDKSSLYGRIGVISPGIPSSGNVAACSAASVISKCLCAECPRFCASCNITLVPFLDTLLRDV